MVATAASAEKSGGADSTATDLPTVPAIVAGSPGQDPVMAWVNASFPTWTMPVADLGSMAAEIESVSVGSVSTAEGAGVFAAAHRPAHGGRVVVWLLDGGATNHVTPLAPLVLCKTGEQRKLRGVGGSVGTSVCHYKALQFAGATSSLFVCGALYSPDMDLNILSESRLLDSGFLFAPDKTYMWHREQPAVHIKINRRGDLFWVETLVPDWDVPTTAMVSFSDDSKPIFDESDEMENAEFSAVLRALSKLEKHYSEGHVDLLSPGDCEACDRTKRGKKAVRRTKADERTRAARLDGVVATDLCGPFRWSFGGSRYLQPFVRLLDFDIVPTFCKTKHSRATRANLLKYCEVRPRPRVCKFDNGNEFKSVFTEELVNLDIRKYNSPEYTSPLNGSAEVANRVLCLGAACVMWDVMKRFGLSADEVLIHWPSAMKYIATCVNRTVVRDIPGKGRMTSHEARTSEDPWLSNSHLRPWFQPGHYIETTPARKLSKIEPRRRPCRLLSYSFNSRKIYVLDVERNTIEPTYDFIPNKFVAPAKTSFDSKSAPSGEEVPVPEFPLSDDEAVTVSPDVIMKLDDGTRLADVPVDLAFPVEEMRKLDDQHVDKTFVAAMEAAHSVSVSVKDALASDERPQWLGGIKEECDNIRKSWVWSKPPPGVRALPTKMVLVKKDDGRYKARIVVIGFLQMFCGTGGSDSGVFAPTLQMDSFRVALATHAGLGDDLEGLDVSGAFLLAEIDEDIWVLPPRGWVPSSPEDEQKLRDGFCWKLVRALYGLRRAPRLWFRHLRNIFVNKFGWRVCPSDPCIFMEVTKDGVTTIYVFVDDSFTAGARAKQCKEKIMNEFPSRDLGKLREFLGCQIAYEGGAVILHQERYIRKFIRDFNISEAGVPTPIERKLSFKGEPATHDEAAWFRSLIGTLGYACMMTRPDLAWAQSHLARHMSAVTKDHVSAAKHYARYVAGTPTARLVYRKLKPGERFRVHGISDSDWKGCLDTGRSHGGHLVCVNDQVVIWRSQVMKTSIKTASTVAEFCQMSLCSKDLDFTRKLYDQWWGPQDPRYMTDPAPSILEGDNMGANSNAHGEGSAKGIRHLDHTEFHVRDLVEQGRIKIKYVRTDDNSADVLTKPAVSRPKLVSAFARFNFILPSYVKKSSILKVKKSNEKTR